MNIITGNENKNNIPKYQGSITERQNTVMVYLARSGYQIKPGIVNDTRIKLAITRLAVHHDR